MKYLIMGCNGMAGHVISLYLKEQGHDVHGFARKQSDLVDTIVGDAEDEKLVRKTIEEGEYDYVVNCIAVCGNRESKGGLSECIFPAFSG